MAQKLGFSIGYNVCGYALLIPHYGTVVVGEDNRIGNYCVLHTSTCITSNGKKIGDGLFLSTGAKLTGSIELGDNVMIAANSVVTKSFAEGNIMIAGMPAIKKRDNDAWYMSSEVYFERVKKIEELKRIYGLT